MAIDTRSRRASVLGVATPWLLVLPEPDNTVGSEDRQHVAYAYAGIAAGEATSTETSPIAYNPAVLHALTRRPKPKPIPRSEPSHVQPDVWAVDYTAPSQQIRFVTHPGIIVAEVIPFVDVKGLRPARIAFVPITKQIRISFEKHYYGRSAGVMDLVSELRRYKRARALDEERRLVQLILQGVPVEDAVRSLVEG